ncbi:MAG TPA: Rho termination factor N-terminal domain-containing protein [Acidiferrobacterales bacterium]
MQNKTIDELRALAKSRGLSGYAKLRKDQLLALLKTASPRQRAGAAGRKPAVKKTAQPKPAARAAKPGSAPSKAAGGRAATRHRPAVSAPAGKARISPGVETARTAMPAPPDTDGADAARAEAGAGAANPPWPPAWWQPPARDAESAKYAISAATEPADDLGEDIERLPMLRGPTLMLLPQKPGILHAYWSLPADADAAALRLRLCRMVGGLTEVLSEVALPSARGNFYFHLDADFGAGDALVQLGEYRDGVFLSLMQRGLPRLPLRHAGPAFWLSAALFRRRFVETPLGSSGAFLSRPDVISSR